MAGGPFINGIINRTGSIPGAIQGLFANRPAAGYAPGDWYMATDTQVLYEWTGTAWVILLSNGGAGGTPTLQNVMDNGNTTTDNLVLTTAALIQYVHAAFTGSLVGSGITAARVWTLPDATGTIALISNIPAAQNLQNVLGVGNTSTINIVLTTAALLQYLNGGFTGNLVGSGITAARVWTLPDKTGTIAMTSDIPAAAGLQAVLTAGNSASLNIILTGGALLQFTNGAGFTGQILGTLMTANRQWNMPDASGIVALINYVLTSSSATAYAPVLTDAGGYKTLTNAATITVTIPLNAIVNFPIGTIINWEQGGAGKITFTIAAGGVLNSKGGNKSTNGQNVVVSTIYKGGDVWTLFGDLTT